MPLAHREAGLTPGKGMLFDNVNTSATCFELEHTEIDKQADLIPGTAQAKSPEENAAEKMGYTAWKKSRRV